MCQEEDLFIDLTGTKPVYTTYLRKRELIDLTERLVHANILDFYSHYYYYYYYYMRFIICIMFCMEYYICSTY